MTQGGRQRSLGPTLPIYAQKPFHHLHRLDDHGEVPKIATLTNVFITTIHAHGMA